MKLTWSSRSFLYTLEVGGGISSFWRTWLGFCPMPGLVPLVQGVRRPCKGAVLVGSASPLDTHWSDVGFSSSVLGTYGASYVVGPVPCLAGWFVVSLLSAHMMPVAQIMTARSVSRMLANVLCRTHWPSVGSHWPNKVTILKEGSRSWQC